MADNSLKRIFGESPLERKCRFLFVACLSVLVFVAFWWVEHVTEALLDKEGVVPGPQIQETIQWYRAMLATVGILTVFVGMLVLYIALRCLVVRPLKHLRDVSDEISRGNTESRAEIHTSDEFEELASAINDMSRQLRETREELRQLKKDQ